MMSSPTATYAGIGLAQTVASLRHQLTSERKKHAGKIAKLEDSLWKMSRLQVAANPSKKSLKSQTENIKQQRLKDINAIKQLERALCRSQNMVDERDVANAQLRQRLVQAHELFSRWAAT
jgi:uncharacterized protein (DUF342 family)